MAKRFTDTNKWKMEWFRKLGSRKRDIWNYLHDNCDFNGLYEIDLGLMSYQLGFEEDEQKVTLDEIKDVLNGKVIQAAKDRLLLPAFVRFQYGKLSEAVRPHASVIRDLKKEGVWEEYASTYLRDKDKDKDKDKNTDTDKDKEGWSEYKKVRDSISGSLRAVGAS